MQRIYLSAPEQKLINRWRLIVIGFYSVIVFATVVLVALQPARNRGTLEARMNPPERSQPVNLSR